MQETITFSHNRFIDVKATFVLGDYDVLIAGKPVDYTQISGITRTFYDRTTIWGISQANPNQYNIELKDGRVIKFRVAHSEEDAYRRKLQALQNKIYHTNSLGFGLTSTAIRNAANSRQKDIQFAKERPVRDFSLEKAIGELLTKCGLELNDLTDAKTIKKKRQKQVSAPVNENIFVELAKLISNHDEAVVSEVFTHVERYQLYYQDKTKDYLHRGMNENTPKELIRWLAMIDVLEDYGYAEEIDWKDTVENIAASLSRIKEKAGIQIDTSMDLSFLDGNETVETLETDRVLNLIGLNTVEHGYSLTNIDIDSDSYIICLTPNKVYKQCEKLLQGTEFSISSF